MREIAGWARGRAAAVGCTGLLAWVAAGCQPEGGETGVVARVFETRITASELREYRAGLSERLRSSAEGVDGLAEDLQGLIDKELLLHEARARDLQEDPLFLDRVAIRRNQMLQREFRQHLSGMIDITPQDERSFFRESGRDRQIRMAYAEFDSLAAARKARQRILRGTKFEQMARRHSPQPGGLHELYSPDRFYVPHELHPSVRRKVFGLQVGQSSEPVFFNKRYYLIQVVAEDEAELDRQRASIRRQLHQIKLAEKQRQARQELARKYNPRIDRTGFTRFLKEARRAFSLAQMDTGITVAHYGERSYTSGQLAQVLRRSGRSELDPSDSAAVAEFVLNRALPEQLVLAEAESLGLHRGPEQTLAEQRDRMLVDELLRREVKDPVQVSYEETRDFFEEHPETFRRPEQFEVQEILVETEAEARALRHRIETEMALDLDALADEHTLRPQGQGEGGRLHFHAIEAPLYGGLVEAVEKAPLHRLQGPVRVDEGYSLFWVLDRSRKPLSFEDRRVQFVARNMLTRIRQNEQFDRFIEQLRDRYANDVQVYRAHLAELLATGK